MDGLARLARNLDWNSRLQPGSAAGQNPVSDPAGAITAHNTDLAASSTVQYGFVIDALPSVRCYRVQPENGGPVIDCSLGMRGTVSPMGSYDADTLIAGTHVRYVQQKNDPTGLIVAIEPMYMYDPRLFYGDVISQGSNTGLNVETGFHEVFLLGGFQGPMSLNGGVTDYAGRTPFDSLEIGEFNRSMETGLMLHMDPYMAFMRADEWSGLWMFYWDGLVRLSGQNFQRWTSGSELESYDDEGEHMWYKGIATYPWEHMGQLQGPDSSVLQERSADVTQNTAPYYARFEPDNDDLQPFHRFREYAGYLGQGQKKMMCAPLQTGTDYQMLYSDQDYEPIGLHEQNIDMAGHWSVRTASGITIAKRPILPVPKRIRDVTHYAGDQPSTYKASSQYGSGSAHKMQPLPTVASGEFAMSAAATVMDHHAYLFNWSSAHPFHYHSDDYYYPEESGYDHISTNQEIPTWGDLNVDTSWYLGDPSYNSYTLDHRSDNTKNIYHSTAYLTLLEEGGVLLGDGWGSEIRMSNGCIFIDAPGDIFMSSGRNLIGWGGRDICWRAWNCVDVTANEKDVRIKAEKNCWILAGNSEATGESQGGVIIECRADGPPKYDFYNNTGEDVEANGIIFKALGTEIIGWAESIYLRTRGPAVDSKSAGDSGTAEDPLPKVGDITLDAYGKGDIVTRSNFVKHFVHCAVAHIFPDTAGSTVHFFTEDGVTLGGDVYTDGDLLSYGSHLAKGDFLTPEGHHYSTSGGLVGKLTTASAGNISDAIDQGHQYEIALIAWGVSSYAKDMTRMWYGTSRPGKNDVISSVWVHLRTEEDYKSDGFFLYESRWQQMARLGGSSGTQTWTENYVEANQAHGDITSDETYPFPGRDRFQETGSGSRTWLQHDLKLYNMSTGQAADRGSTYESPVTLNSLNDVKLDGNYLIIGK